LVAYRKIFKKRRRIHWTFCTDDSVSRRQQHNSHLVQQVAAQIC